MLVEAEERERLAALSLYDVYGTPPEAEFDRLTAIAATLFNTTTTMLTLIGADRIWVKSVQGGSDKECLRLESFCQHAICQSEPLVIPDARTHPLVQDNPLVHANPPVLFYAAAPLLTPAGQRIGTLCVFDPVPREEPTAREVAALAGLAAIAMDLLAGRLERRAAQRLAVRAGTIERLLGKIAQASSQEQALLCVAAELDAAYQPVLSGIFKHTSLGGVSSWARMGTTAGWMAPTAYGGAWLLDDILRSDAPRLFSAPLVAACAADPLANALYESGAEWVFGVPLASPKHDTVLAVGLPPGQSDIDLLESELAAIIAAIGPALRRKADQERLLMLETALDRAPEGVIITRTDAILQGSRTLYVNQRFCGLTGYDQDELVGRPTATLQGPATDLAELHRLQIDLGEGGEGSLALASHRKNGEPFDAEMEISSILVDPDGSIVRMGLLRDVTSKRADERVRRDLEQSFRVMFEANPLPMWIVDEAAGQFLLVNDAAISFYGWPRELFLTMTLTDVAVPEPLLMAEHLMARHKGDMADANTVQHRRADASIVRMAVAAQRHHLAGTNAWLMVFWDMTDAAAAREELSRSNESLKSLAERLNQQTEQLMTAHRLANLGTWTLTSDLETMTWSDDIYRMIGRARLDVEPSLAALLQSLQAADRKLFIALIEEIRLDGRGREIHARLVRQEGRVRHVRIEARKAVVSGQLGGFFGYVQDVSDRWEAEQALTRSEKLATLGHLTSGIAHDFNNLLMVVILNLEEVIDDHLHDHDLQDLLVPALEAAQRGADLTGQLLSYAKQAPLRPQVINLGDFFTALRPLMHQALGTRYNLHVTVEDKRCTPRVDVSQLQTAVLKILLNAKDAMPNGGEVAINARRIMIPSPEFNLDLVPGSYALITIKDSGSGIPPDVLPHIFEPFYTTKDVGAGTGLGLSMVEGFIKQSGGKVLAESEFGNGAMLSLFLPLQTVRLKEKLPMGGSEVAVRVLVVEDQPAVLATVVRMLNQLGYAVNAVENAAVALAQLESGNQFAVLFTDIILPGGMDGIALAQIVRDRYPTMRILLTTGFTNHDLSESNVPGTTILMKPYKRHELMQKMSEVLQGAPAGF